MSALAEIYEPALGLGLTDLTPTDLDLRPDIAAVSDDEINRLMAQRETARTAEDFSTSDSIRDQLNELGVIVEDHPEGPSTWRWA